MPTKEPAADMRQSELDALAFDLYRERMGRTPARRGAEQIAKECYRLAQSFVSVRDSVAAGETPTETPTGPQLADVYTPNESPTHPYNLVSFKHGNLRRAAEVLAWIKNDTKTIEDPDEVPKAFNRKFPGFGWTAAQIELARTIFPAYVA